MPPALARDSATGKLHGIPLRIISLLAPDRERFLNQPFPDGEFCAIIRVSNSANSEFLFLNLKKYITHKGIIKKQFNLDRLVIISPDAGGVERARAYAKLLAVSLAIIDKRREGINEAKAMNIIGDVQGKVAIVIDDMVDTAGTLTKAADLMMERGAESVRAVTTHGLLSGKAYQRIEESKLSELIVTDSIPVDHEQKKIRVLSCADLFADVMHRVHHNTSISSKFLM